MGEPQLWVWVVPGTGFVGLEEYFYLFFSCTMS